MDTNKGYISKRKKGDSLYEELHQEALELLQKLSGGIWTDYNEHDPGITLLENISYAITEVAHKVNIPIEDLLQSSKKATLNSGDNGLFTASDILTTNPVTFNDYRRIWIDQIENVKNIWVYPIDDYQEELDNIKGLLHVFVEKHEYHHKPENEATENEALKAEIARLYHEHRNLCEGLYAIEIFKPLPLVVNFKIMLSDIANAEEVLANIIHAVNDYLAPEVNFSSLSQLQNEELSVNEIFNGPKLTNGFIKEEDLRDPVATIKISDILKIISKIKGIINISDFSLSYVDLKTKELHVIKESFDIPKKMTARVLFPKSNKNLIFENAGISFQPDLRIAKKQLSFIQALDASKFKAASNSENTIAIPEGNLLDIDYHFPIRKQLPEIYGVGDRGISNAATPLRKAQVKQLQAYLLPFDQLIINFLAQISNIYTLYDIDSNQDTSYFTNSLPDIEELLELLQPVGSDYSIEETKNYWNEITKGLNAFFDSHASDRLNSIATQLLARYNEAFQTYTLLKINNISYGDAVNEKGFEKQLLKAKQNYIKEYATISYNRSKSFNYSDIDTLLNENDKIAITGVLKKIAILVGLNNSEIKSFTRSVDELGIHIHPQTLELDVTISHIDIYTPEDHYDILEIDDIEIHEDIKENLYESMHYVGEEDTILNDVLKYGIIPENYTIIKDPNKEDHFYIVHKRDHKTSNIVHIATSAEEAKKSVYKAIHFLTDFSQKSEGFLVLEHVLLLPSYFEDHFGFEMDFSLLDSSLDLIFTHVTQSPFADRDKTVDALLNNLLADTIQYESVFIDGQHQIALCLPNEEAIAVSSTNFRSKIELEKAISELKEVLKKCDIEDLKAITKCLVFYAEYAVDELFFSFKMSFILPSWPVRFQNRNFQQFFKNTLYTEIPIHIVADSYWLSYRELYGFEKVYFKWLKLVLTNDTSKERMLCAYQLIRMLQKFDKGY
ncbi:hypothetical protein [Tenacibaculum sp. M341]|uniref:hypothetical protein n=1 Tax=Tenacibaculum sp. M341 TaxID=2530339 RepID=UPI00104FD53A|nr:hypothetical protein [Tenacibaculum sp. M341]TCI93162.1 hypothetical protein EYW44_05970 [Tenacibaculum sp. M341]